MAPSSNTFTERLLTRMPWLEIKTAVRLIKRSALSTTWDQVWSYFRSTRTPARSRIAFTIAVITLAAKMTKADGVTTQAEAEAFERAYVVPENEHANVKRLFDLASQDTAGFEVYAGQIADNLVDEPELKISVLECLFQIAAADGVLHPAEDHFLTEVSAIFGLSAIEYKSIRQVFVRDPDSPYDILGVRPDASIDDIKKTYRDLVRRHHPDALLSKGVPPEFLIAAERRLAAITDAYEAVQRERGGRPARELERSS